MQGSSRRRWGHANHRSEPISGPGKADGFCFDAASMDQGSARNQASKPEVDDLSTYSAHLVAFATETLPFLQPSNRRAMDIGAFFQGRASC